MFSQLAVICNGTNIVLTEDRPVVTLLLDSRKAISSAGAAFFALSGPRHNGHRFLTALHAQGIRQFIVEEDVASETLTGSNILRVKNVRDALQSLVAWHRTQFTLPVMGITGSNGKTIVKEWLYQLLAPDFSVVKNPGSYNSQTGVPLSVWQLHAHHQLGIFEAGISQPEEMNRLERMIKPTIGIFTNLGPAHDEGFSSPQRKIREKLLLFRDSDVIIYNKDQPDVATEIEKTIRPGRTLIGWGTSKEAALQIQKVNAALYSLTWKQDAFTIKLPFTDAASIENAFHCIAALLNLGYSPDGIQDRISLLRTVPMRLELKQGINGCQIIDDTYNNDLSGLQISLDFLSGIQTKKATVILSDILQSGLPGEELAQRIAEQVVDGNIGFFIGIGPLLLQYKSIFESRIPSRFYATTEAFLSEVDLAEFRNEVILVKGARPFGFEKIVQVLQRKIHGTVMEVDLGAMVHNLNYFKAGLQPGVKLMAMVKAFAYGSGSEEVANLLQYHGVDYLGVAYPDEGVELRKNNIRVPIMVMNPSEESFATLLQNKLEPEIYSISLLKSYTSFLQGKAAKIHLKIDTGMHRLGFEESEIPELIRTLKEFPNVEVASVFSHLAGADETQHDEFTRQQGSRFTAVAATLKNELKIDPILHILNSSGILRFPEFQFGMVRLGIGLYGINPTTAKSQLIPVATLKTVISQLKTISAGESIGYGRRGTAAKEMTLATLAIGYADGFSRGFSRGVGEVLLHGKSAPVVGNVCMDMTMVDVTGIDAHEGDEVIIFGKELPIDVLAARIQTIPYEILTSTSERVKRVFYAESI